MFSWAIWTATGAVAGTLTVTDQAGWSGGTASNLIVGDSLDIDNVVNERNGWYRSTWSETALEAQAQKDNGTWFSVADRCLAVANNGNVLDDVERLSGHDFRMGPHRVTLSNVEYLSAVPSAQILALPQTLKSQAVRLLIGGAHIGQRDLTVRFHYSDGSIGSVVVPIPVDTLTGAARNGAGAGWSREGVIGLTRTPNPAWDRDVNGVTDCGGNGADIVEVSSPSPQKALTGISFLYPGFADATGNTGWLSGPLAVSLMNVNYDVFFTYRGKWSALSQGSVPLSVAPDAGTHALFYQVAWNVNLTGNSEIYLDISCGDDISGNGRLDAAELAPWQTLRLSGLTSPWPLPEICEGRYLAYEIELVDAFEDFPTLYDVSFTYEPDADGDGYGTLGQVGPVDCDDTQASVHPGANEVAGNERDDDCDGDELCYTDADNDGARGGITVLSTDLDCNDPGEARQSAPLDCADNDPTRHPAATEIVGDDIDQNCNNHDLCYVDADRDSYGTDQTDEANGATCQTANSEAKRSGDCDDTDADRFPNNEEIPADDVDQDCDSHDLCYVDEDGDAFGTTQTRVSAGAICSGPGEARLDTDCDDDNASIHPSATELAGNDIDENCDDRVACYADTDGDGARTEATALTAQGDTDCTGPFEGQAGDPLDCADDDPQRHPGAAELAGDNVDQNCDNVEDCFVDADGDGARVQEILAGGENGDADCDDPLEALASEPLDCADDDANRHPGVAEIAGDNLDSDCDNTELCYQDADDDGARTETTALTAQGDTDCTGAFEGQMGDPLDCDDADAAVLPGAQDICNALDDDCNGTIDDGAGPLVTWHPDADGDGFGDPLVSEEGACGPDETWTQDDSDCDDLDPMVHPDGLEICNGIDDDCNEEVDDAEPAVTWYADSDGDGFGDPDGAVDAGCPPDPSFVQDSTDCDDRDSAVFPGAEEICNGIDDDCAGGIDHLGAPRTWYRDADGDGMGNDGETIEADCFPGEGWAEAGGDCDDADPKLAETCLSGSGCGCNQTPSGGHALGLLAGLGLVLRRRYGSSASSVSSSGSPTTLV